MISPSQTQFVQPQLHVLDHRADTPSNLVPTNELVTFVSIAQTPTFVSVKHERRDGLTEGWAT
jgi:hypothetical protein